MTTYLKSGETFEVEVRSMWEEGGETYYGFRARFVPDDAGEPFYIPELSHGIVWNLTQLVTHLMKEGYETIDPTI